MKAIRRVIAAAMGAAVVAASPGLVVYEVLAAGMTAVGSRAPGIGAAPAFLPAIRTPGGVRVAGRESHPFRSPSLRTALPLRPADTQTPRFLSAESEVAAAISDDLMGSAQRLQEDLAATDPGDDLSSDIALDRFFREDSAARTALPVMAPTARTAPAPWSQTPGGRSLVRNGAARRIPAAAPSLPEQPRAPRSMTAMRTAALLAAIAGAGIGIWLGSFVSLKAAIAAFVVAGTLGHGLARVDSGVAGTLLGALTVPLVVALIPSLVFSAGYTVLAAEMAVVLAALGASLAVLIVKGRSIPKTRLPLNDDPEALAASDIWGLLAGGLAAPAIFLIPPGALLPAASATLIAGAVLALHVHFSAVTLDKPARLWVAFLAMAAAAWGALGMLISMMMK